MTTTAVPNMTSTHTTNTTHTINTSVLTSANLRSTTTITVKTTVENITMAVGTDSNNGTVMFNTTINPQDLEVFKVGPEHGIIIDVVAFTCSFLFVLGVFLNISAMGVFRSPVFHLMSFAAHMQIICLYNMAILAFGMIRHHTFRMDLPGHYLPEEKRHHKCIQIWWFSYIIENGRSLSISLLLYNRIRAQRKLDMESKCILALRMPVLMNASFMLASIVPVSGYMNFLDDMNKLYNRTECTFAFLKPYNGRVPPDVAISDVPVLQELLNALLLLVLCFEMLMKKWRHRKALEREKMIAETSSSEMLLFDLGFSIPRALTLPNIREELISRLSRNRKSVKKVDDKTSMKSAYSITSDENKREEGKDLRKSNVYGESPNRRDNTKEIVTVSSTADTFASSDVKAQSSQEDKSKTRSIARDKESAVSTSSKEGKEHAKDGAPISNQNIDLESENNSRLSIAEQDGNDEDKASDEGATNMTVVLVILHLLTAIPRKSQHSALIAKYTSYAAIRSYTVLALLDLLTFFYLGIFFLVMCACCSIYRNEAYRRMFEIEDVTNASESSLATATRLMNTHLRQVAAVWSTEEFQAVTSATSVGREDDIMARFLRLSQDYGAIIENFELNPYVITFSNPNECTLDKGKTVDSVRALNTSPVNDKENSQTCAMVKSETDVDSRKCIAAKALRLKELIKERNMTKQQERLVAREKRRCEMMKEWHKQGTWL